jgi:hypothetical protein
MYRIKYIVQNWKEIMKTSTKIYSIIIYWWKLWHKMFIRNFNENDK